MAKDFAKAFYKSTAWQRCRASYISKVHGLCEKCGRPGEIVHHKETLNPINIGDPTVSLNHDLLEYLCMECHNREHGGDVLADDVMFDEEGNVVARK